MPQFTQWNVPSPFPNVLYNPMAVDKAIAEMGHLDIERQKFGLEREKFDRQGTEGDALLAPYLTGAGGGAGTGTAPAGGGGGGSSGLAPPDINTPAGQVAQRTAAFWAGQGYTPHQVAGILAGGPAAESGFDPGAKGDGGTSLGLYQHHADRMEAMKKRYGPNPTEAQQHEFAAWEISPQGTHAHVGAALKQAKTPEEAAAIWTKEFERPANADARAAQRASVASRYLNYGNAGPRVPAVAAGAPGAAPAIVPPTPVGTNLNAQVVIPPPRVTGQADMDAVKQASVALLAMPEAEAAIAYGPTVRSLQAQGLAMNAPPTYPGHAALQAIVNGGEPATPDVAPSPIALRTGGTDVAGPGAGAGAAAPDVILDAGGKPLLPPSPAPAPNRMAYGTGLPGVTIGLPTNGLAPPPTAAASAAAPPSPGTASGGAATRPPVLTPPPAPRRVIPREEVLPHGLTASQVELARRMVRSGAPVASVAVHIEEMKRANTAARQQDAQQAAIDANTRFERDKYLQSQQTAAAKDEQDRADKAEAQRIAREAAGRDTERLDIERKRFEQGATQSERDDYNLRAKDPSSQDYTDSYIRKRWQISPNGTVIENDMSHYPAPARSIQRPTYVPAPTGQALDEVRKADTDAKVITAAIDHYGDVFTKGGAGGTWDAYFANPRDPKTQQLLGAFDRLKTVLRSPVYYNTGVLQPAEMALLKEDLVSPQTLRGVFATPEALATRMGEIKLAILTRQDAELRSIGKDGVIVRDKADFAKIPPGGKYYDENGHLRLKPERQ